MKNIFLVFILLVFSAGLFAQGNIGINDPNPDSLAILDIESNDKGVLIPRMSEMDRLAIPVTPAQNGLLVYQLDANAGFWYFNSTNWQKLGETGGRIVDFGFSSHLGNNPSSEHTFLGATVVVSVSAPGQKILITANKAFGSTALGGADNLDLCIGYQQVGTMEGPEFVGSCSYDMSVPQNTRMLFGLSGIAQNLPPGDYEVGLIGDCDSDPTKWNSNEYGYVTALVFE